jgi:hypothetical protein
VQSSDFLLAIMSGSRMTISRHSGLPWSARNGKIAVEWKLKCSTVLNNLNICNLNLILNWTTVRWFFKNWINETKIYLTFAFLDDCVNNRH